MNIDNLLSMPGAKPYRYGDRAVKLPCPVHDDNKASLVVWEHAGKMFVRCFAGCNSHDVEEALGISRSKAKEQKPVEKKVEQVGKEVSRYVYHSVDGQPLACKVRYEPKEFRMFTMRDGEWIPGLSMPDGVSRLYNADILATAGPSVLYFNEGEKATDLIGMNGHLGTCHINGSSLMGHLNDKDAELLRPHEVKVIADLDPTGDKFASGLVEWLRMKGVKASAFSSATGEPKSDLYDHISAGLPLSALVRRTDLEPESLFRRFSEVERTQVDFLWYPYIPIGQVTAITGDGDLGKSWLLCTIASCASVGTTPSGDTIEKAGSIFLASEDDTGTVLIPRVVSAGGNLDAIVDIPGHLGIDTDDGIAKISAVIDAQRQGGVNVKLLFIDPVFGFLNTGGDINSPVFTRSVMRKLVDLAQKKEIAVVMLIHESKQGQMLASVEWRNAARSVLKVCWHPNVAGLRLVQHTKHNYSSRGRDFAFEFYGGVPFYQFENVPKPEWPKRRGA